MARGSSCAACLHARGCSPCLTLNSDTLPRTSCPPCSEIGLTRTAMTRPVHMVTGAHGVETPACSAVHAFGVDCALQHAAGGLAA